MRIVGYCIKDGMIANSDGEIRREPPYLPFLLDNKPDTIRVLSNMKSDVAWLARMEGFSVAEARKLLAGEVYHKPYFITYVPRRFLAIKYGWSRDNPFVFFSDASRYREDNSNEPALDKAITAAETATAVYNALADIGLKPKTLTSPIRVVEQDVLQRIDLPTHHDMPEEVTMLAHQCAHGGWIEAFQIGHWKEAWDYDIRACYGYHTSRLLDTRHGKWVRSSRYIDEALYGFCSGEVDIDSTFSPIVFRKHTLVRTPFGSWRTVLTKDEIDFINEYDLGTFRIDDGYWWIPEGDNLHLPLQNIMQYFYSKREVSTGIAREVFKAICSGLWGKFAEIRLDGAGPLFNAVWGAVVETRARLSVAQFVIDHDLVDDLIHVTVDGVLTSRAADISDEGSGMGTWQLTGSGAAVVISSGIYVVQSKDKNGNGETPAITYDWLTSEIKSNPDADHYMLRTESVLTLGEAVVQDRIRDAGNYEIIEKRINIGNETKRMYSVLPRNGGELLSGTYSSIPWDVGILQNLSEPDENAVLYDIEE